MFISEYFIYDGIPSTEFGLKLVKMDTSMTETNFGLRQNIVEQSGKNSDLPYLIEVKNEPLPIELTFAKEGEWKEEDKQKVVKWLFQGKYKPLISSDNLGVAYYCTPVGDARRFYNGMGQGYVTIEFRCDAPYGWSYPLDTQFYDLSSNTTKEIIEWTNKSNIKDIYYPEIQFEVFAKPKSEVLTVSNNSVTTTEILDMTQALAVYETTDGVTKGVTVAVDSVDKNVINFTNMPSTTQVIVDYSYTKLILTNLTDGGKQFIFTDLQSGEIIYVDNRRKQIMSSLKEYYNMNIYRYANFNKNWLRLVEGINQIEVEGTCKIQTKMQFPMSM